MGLRDLDEMLRLLDDNHLFHAARGELLRRLGRAGEAATAFLETQLASLRG